ncbi:pyridoxal 5'-phosphate synthase glutaminase subunit PdxT [Cellulomonas alba]|uniref:Pyridoxal 5'-phosphate synthase subunit PdxT n=1 Tax=Cellulomonas alba TaxID=3053467 RepID=A0ABT7SB95_9CELL|nr:pyridoxal 5'-phosphate synthase glutaminase subunit PdxT [Cellulomonas alba]MDM7853445.1 pyridoxal 5'-phosphate synthase glutaminase subunit PdxT [Cellulomonas alba]
MTATPTVGVLALQGDVREHLHALETVGLRGVPVRRERELDAVEALVIPGGESTTIDKLLRAFDLFGPVQARLRAGMPAYGSCAGMILLADRVLDGIDGQQTLGGVDVTVRRNAFGRQVDSFETDLTIDGIDEPLHAVFIRAPWVEEVGPAARVVGRVESGPAAGRIVAVRQGPLLVTSFHPEVTGDVRVHELFGRIVRESL